MSHNWNPATLLFSLIISCLIFMHFFFHPFSTLIIVLISLSSLSDVALLRSLHTLSTSLLHFPHSFPVCIGYPFILYLSPSCCPLPSSFALYLPLSLSSFSFFYSIFLFSSHLLLNSHLCYTFSLFLSLFAWLFSSCGFIRSFSSVA